MSGINADEQIRRWEVLLRIGQMTQADFEARKAALRAAPAVPAQQQRGYDQRGQGQRPVARTQASSAPAQHVQERSEFYKAPYRFVPYAGHEIALAEAEALKPLNEPKDEGLCAEIIIEWTAESPLLIGQDGANAGDIVPMRRRKTASDQSPTEYYIPGATIRGAIRSVAEIYGAARLTQVNMDQSFGLRDFNHASYSNSQEDINAISTNYPLADPSKLKAGWLELIPGSDEDKNDPSLQNGKLQITPLKSWYAIELEALLRHPQLRRSSARDIVAFSKKEMLDKYRDAGLVTRRGDGEFIATAEKAFAYSVPSGDENGKIARLEEGGKHKGHLVLSGRAPAGKKRDYLFSMEAEGQPVEIHPALWQRFVRTHCDAVKDKLKPVGAYKGMPEQLRAKVKLPVFYVGDLDTQSAESFAFGLTRLFKVPHLFTMRAVMDASRAGASALFNHENGTADAVDRAKLDMVDALFGYVYENEAPQQPSNASQKPGDFARKGRVAFSSAVLKRGEAQLSEVIETVMMGPRASFAPFYLVGDNKDYSAGAVPLIAGRKRYPVRFASGDANSRFRSVKDRLKDQVTAIVDMQKGRAPGRDVLTRLVFLQPKGQEKLVFESSIRLFNCTAAELALILKAVTLDLKEDLRHSLGRAKAFGAGQLKPNVRAILIEKNLPESLPSLQDGRHEKVDPEWLNPLQNHLKAALGGRMAGLQEAIKALEACCNPTIGEDLARKGQLDYLRLNEMAPGRNKGENPYQTLRNTVKPPKDRSKSPIQRKRLLTIG
jgi:CRISPR-associated protein (TIGR03986 family)